MTRCQRCNSEGVSWTNDTASLIGGVKAHLCASCHTEWEEVCRAHPLWDQFLVIEARSQHYTSLALARQPVGEEAYLQLSRDNNAAHQAIHEVGVEFVKPLAAVHR